ncbi:MAG: 4-hydroxy-tetrahydrodipicolinate synthase [Pseudomonadota bacterium]
MASSAPFEGSIVAVVTPMSGDGSVDYPMFTALLDWHLISGTQGVVVAGTTGEGAALTEIEFQKLVATAVDQLGDRLPVIAGIGGTATHQYLGRIARAEDVGAQGLLCVTPYYLRTTQSGLIAHFETLAEAATRPIVLYNVPSRTGVDLKPETTLALCRHERICGIKEAVPDLDRVAKLVAGSNSDFVVLSGDDESCLEAMFAGARGVISVTANVAPAAMVRLAKLALSGQNAAARELDGALGGLHKVLMAEPNPIPVKAALHHLGRLDNHLRLPLVPAAQPTRKALAQLLDDDLAHLVAGEEE